MIISSVKHEVKVTQKSLYEIRMVLIIRYLQKYDMGTYRCAAKNSLGEVESSIRLYGEYTQRFPQLSNEVSRRAHKEYLIRLLDETQSKWEGRGAAEKRRIALPALHIVSMHVYTREHNSDSPFSRTFSFIPLLDNRNARD